MKEPNELVFKLIDLENISTSRVGLSPFIGIVSPAYIVLEGKNVNMKYSEFYFLSMWQRCIFNQMGDDGVRSSLNSNDLLNTSFVYPPLTEQYQIASYLDTQCAHIDNIIEKTKASIEEYKKLKQAVITQAVTKGVRGDRPMKDSGIEWIGEIPEEWEEKRIKYLFSLRDERNDLPLNKVNLISLYTDLGVVQHSDLEKTTGNKASTADGYKLVYENDIVVNIILCWMGAIGRSSYNGVTSPAYDIYIPSNEVECRYYHYYFRTSGFSGDCYKRGRGIMAMRWRTYSDQFRDISVLYPPLNEQKEIVSYLDKKCAEIDAIITKKQQFITEMESYKKSMIYEYVTGKKEVPKGENRIEFSTDFKVALLMCIILQNTEIKGRIHMQKVVFSSDILLNLFELQYYRFPHGPYDVNIQKYEQVLSQNGWVDIEKINGSICYKKTERFDDFMDYYKKLFSDIDNDIKKICQAFNVHRTAKAEKMATVLASWNDFLIDGVTPTDEMIVNDIVTNWTENKANIDKSTWYDTISKLKEQGLIPKGFGKKTLSEEAAKNVY